MELKFQIFIIGNDIKIILPIASNNTLYYYII